MKKTKRKAFNFLRSYFDVLNELPKDKDKLDFLLAIINKQFLNEDPTNLSFIPNLCYESQRHSIEASVTGWERATKETLGTTPSTTPPTTYKEEEEKEKEEVQEKEEIDYQEIKRIFNSYNSEIPKISVITASRKKAIKNLLKNYTLENIGEVFQKVFQSDFLQGKNKNNWVATFDWILKPANFLKILEDNYKNKTNGINNENSKGATFEEIGAILEEKFGHLPD